MVGKGKAKIGHNKSISNVLYVPRATRSLISVGKLIDQGHIVIFMLALVSLSTLELLSSLPTHEFVTHAMGCTRSVHTLHHMCS